MWAGSLAEDHYWNHNTAFHAELCRLAAAVPGPVLDVGCGDGLLLERLTADGRPGTGIELDPDAAARASARLAARTGVTVIEGDVLDAPSLPEGGYSVVTCVAALHHLPLDAGLRRLADLVRPGGVLAVIGCAANRSVVDWGWSAAAWLPLRLEGVLRHEARDIGVRTRHPDESLSEIRAVARRALPGACVRRRRYYRYSLIWRRSTESLRAS